MSFPATSLDPAGRLRASQHTFCVVVKRLWEPHRTSVLITRVTGTGVPELFGLKWSDVELGRRLLCIRRRYHRTTRAPESPIMKGLRSSRTPKLTVEPFLQLMQGIQFSLSNSCSAAFLMTSESLYVTRRSSSRRAVSQKPPAFVSLGRARTCEESILELVYTGMPEGPPSVALVLSMRSGSAIFARTSG